MPPIRVVVCDWRRMGVITKSHVRIRVIQFIFLAMTCRCLGSRPAQPKDARTPLMLMVFVWTVRCAKQWFLAAMFFYYTKASSWSFPSVLIEPLDCMRTIFAVSNENPLCFSLSFARYCGVSLVSFCVSIALTSSPLVEIPPKSPNVKDLSKSSSSLYSLVLLSILDNCDLKLTMRTTLASSNENPFLWSDSRMLMFLPAPCGCWRWSSVTSNTLDAALPVRPKSPKPKD
mmetsp:Transcript_5499/g.12183  ORF Transcript_5499/g.12183 Transcript_5499/m.12183 type:complete len:230 (-) Transcript_5499:343-1032(-)